MVYSTTITRKGQITIPKSLREQFGFSPDKRISIEVTPKRQELRLKAYHDIVEIAGTFHPQRKKNALKAREYMAKHYERI